jgi:hypothetical protein
LGEITGLPVIELDKLFWQPGLAVTPRISFSAYYSAETTGPIMASFGDPQAPS